jgi:hypothetical protein
MDLFDTLTWIEILVKTTFLGTPTLTVPVSNPTRQEMEASTSCMMVHQGGQGESKVPHINISEEESSRGPLRRQTRE